MTRTKDDAPARPSVEVCPVCASLDVHAREPDWFAITLDRRDELRGEPSAGTDEVVVEFVCRDCGGSWS